MKRNFFGDALPSNLDEIVTALRERQLAPEEAQAELFEPDHRDVGDFNGWCAEISDAETGDNRICTLGFPSREVLERALEDAGITLITVSGE